MRLGRAIAGAGLASLFVASPGVASTLPRIDTTHTSADLALGVSIVPDVSFDLVGDGRDIGVSTIGLYRPFLSGPDQVDLRFAYRIGSNASFSYGALISAGWAPAVNFEPEQFPHDPINESGTRIWCQPALLIAWHPWPLLAVRASLGPVFPTPPAFFSLPPWTAGWVPNLELAFRITEHDEFTVGGDSFVGWRHTWDFATHAAMAK